MIDLIEISKSFGDKRLLQKASFHARSGEKIAIIGKNGAGKSTLLKIIAGVLKPDEGKRSVQNGLKIAMLSQDLDFDNALSLNEYIKRGLKDLFAALKRFKALQSELEKDSENKTKLKELEDLIHLLDFKDAWDLDSKILRVLESFGLKDKADKSLLELSGGELRRAQLSHILLNVPDIILLDEPTNHLDVYMSEFLITLLKKLNSCLIFISHDRYFIDAVASSCVEVEDGVLRSYKGGYSAYLEKRLLELKSLEKSHESLLKTLKSEEEWLRRGVKARLKRNEGRKERLFALREQAKKNPGLINKLKVQLDRAGDKKISLHKNKQKMLFELDNLSKTLGEKALFTGFSTRILQREKIAIVGKNGCGKSTFLKILLGHEKADGGIKRADLKIGYFDQKRELINENLSIEEIFCPNGGDRVEVRGKNMHIFGYLKQFLFPKELLKSPVSLLSGGEKNRLALALLFTKHYDLLILDEPTNDLDINTINILEEYLLEYQGAIIFVSHDRYFVDKIAHKLYAFNSGKIHVEHCSYQDYLAYEEENTIILKELKKEDNSKSIKEKSKKLSYKDQNILQNHPVLIEEVEAKIAKLNVILSDAKLYQEYGLQTLHEEMRALQNDLFKLEEEYLNVLEKQENLI